MSERRNDEIEKFEIMVDYLWENVILENNGVLLNKLTILDKNMFYEFMLSINPYIKYLLSL